MLANKAAPITASAVKAEACVFKTGAPDCSKLKDEPLVANVQKDQGCLTVELGDALLEVFRTCTGR
jgi:hypothetical protein